MKRKSRDWLVLIYCFLVAGVCLSLCSKSSFLYPINDWTDANAFLSVGKGMVNGRVMYRDLYEHKGPLLYALHWLCSLVDSADFTAVFGLEALAFTAFLIAAHHILKLHGAKRSVWLMLPLIAAVVLSSVSFQQGDSAEELCLPMVAWSLYSLLYWIRNEAPHRMSTGWLVVNGLLFGGVLWIKFTMLGLYIPWILGVLWFAIVRRSWRDALTAAGWFALGVGLATAPWLIYFGVNDALLPWLKTYLYDNIFLYQTGETLGALARLKAIVHSGWDWFTQNLAYTLPILAGALWLTLRNGTPKAKDKTTGNANEQSQATTTTLSVSATEKVLVWAMLGVAALGVFIGGKSYVYYGLILAVFAPMGTLWLCAPLDALLTHRRALSAVLGCLLTLGAGGFCLAVSPNAPDLLKPRDQTMQYQFAAIVNQTPGATLLNYGFMDAGFYTACHIAPSVKYFHQTNMPLQEMLTEQARYITEGVTDYVVTRGKQPLDILTHYELIATANAPANFWYHQVFLYRNRNLKN